VLTKLLNIQILFGLQAMQAIGDRKEFPKQLASLLNKALTYIPDQLPATTPFFEAIKIKFNYTDKIVMKKDSYI
jgi:hypothetical protein